MFNAVHEALSHKGRFAMEYVQITTPHCPVRVHKVLVGVAAVENGVVVHKMVVSQDMDFWMNRARRGVEMTFPSTLPQEQLDAWAQQCEEHHVGFRVAPVVFSEREEQAYQALIQRSTVRAAPKKRAA